MSDPTTKQRWYALHRARRVFKRDQERHATDLGVFGFAIQRLGTDTPAADYLLRAAEFLMNPPLIVDPVLPDGGLNMYRPRRRLP